MGTIYLVEIEVTGNGGLRHRFVAEMASGNRQA
jgi:hypothetical protein